MNRLFCLAGAALFFCFSAWAQPQGPVAKIYVIKAKPGMETKFEAAYKQHIEWHREQKDTWAWEAWQYESGDRYGQYVVVTPGHQWKDFDVRGEMGAADAAHAAEHMLPLVESIEVWWSASRPDFSRMEEMPEKVALARVTDYHVKPGKSMDFEGVLRKANQALEEADYPGRVIWTQSLTGKGGVYTLLEFLPDWASLAPPEKSVIDALNAQLGAEETAKLAGTFYSCVEATESHIVRYLSDLSYVPSGQ